MATVVSGAISSGMTISLYTRKIPAPSILADSSSSFGMVRINWTIRKMKNAPPPSTYGRTSGKYVSVSPRLLYMMYWETTVTWDGSISVPSTMANRNPLPANSSRPKPKETRLELITAPISSVFRKNLPNVRPAATCQPSR